MYCFDRDPSKILTDKPIVKMTLGKDKCRWEEQFRIYLKEIYININIFIDSARYGLLDSPCDCGIKLPDSIKHEVTACIYSKDYFFIYTDGFVFYCHRFTSTKIICIPYVGVYGKCCISRFQ